MIKRMGIVNSVLAIFTIITVTLFVIGGCDSNNSEIGIGDDDTGGCENISGTSSGVIRTAGDTNCDSQLENGCFLGEVKGSVSGDEATFYETREDFNVITTKFTVMSGLILITPSNGDQLFGHIVTVLDKDGKAGSGLTQWLPDESDGQFNGADGHVVQNLEIDPENMTYKSTWSGVLCVQ